MTILDPSTTFAALCDSVGLDVRLRKAVSRLGHASPTLVQTKCLNLAVLEGRDLLVRARTGSGKTLAYCLPLLHKLLQNAEKKKKTGVGAIILVPTRELCNQVHQTMIQLTYYCDDVLSGAVLSTGRGRGEATDRQEAMLRDEPDFLVATPAGLLAQIRKGALCLKETVETLVVDEADLVLSFGYANDVAEIIKALPRIYQGFLMSATLSPDVDSLKKIVLNSPVILKLEQEETAGAAAGQLKQFYIPMAKKDKWLTIYVFLKLGMLKGKGLFFVNSTDGGYRLKLFLEQFHIRSAVLNAELPFRSRMNIIEQFNLGNFDYLIATDASTDAGNSALENSDERRAEQTEGKIPKERKKDAEYGVSRGLDFRHVSFVVNVDFPPNAKSYAHRVGRTARGGAKGVALSLVDGDSANEAAALHSVQDDQPKVPLSATAAEMLHAIPKESADRDAAMAPQDQVQPMPLDFNLREIEAFRYRVDDVSRAVTKIAVREARAAELRAEVLNSERLQSHFEDNPADLQLLRHDRIATHTARIQEHLKHVPKYLLPNGMQVANLNRKKRKRRSKNSTGGARRSDNDPLQAFETDVDLDGVEGTGINLPMEQKTTPDNKVYSNTKSGTGQSTAGRNVWKQRHRKGEFSGKKRKSERKKHEPLGL